jgi:hypothetical protein
MKLKSPAVSGPQKRGNHSVSLFQLSNKFHYTIDRGTVIGTTEIIYVHKQPQYNAAQYNAKWMAPTTINYQENSRNLTSSNSQSIKDQHSNYG